MAQWTRVVTQTELTEAVREYLIKKGDITKSDNISTSGGGVVMNIEDAPAAEPNPLAEQTARLSASADGIAALDPRLSLPDKVSNG